MANIRKIEEIELTDFIELVGMHSLLRSFRELKRGYDRFASEGKLICNKPEALKRQRKNKKYSSFIKEAIQLKPVRNSVHVPSQYLESIHMGGMCCTETMNRLFPLLKSQGLNTKIRAGRELYTASRSLEYKLTGLGDSIDCLINNKGRKYFTDQEIQILKSLEGLKVIVTKAGTEFIGITISPNGYSWANELDTDWLKVCKFISLAPKLALGSLALDCSVDLEGDLQGGFDDLLSIMADNEYNSDY